MDQIVVISALIRRLPQPVRRLVGDMTNTDKVLSRLGLATDQDRFLMQDKDSEIAELKARLAEMEDTLRAIRGGDVDAFPMDGKDGKRVYTLKGAEEPYRVLVERMHESAVPSLALDGAILDLNLGGEMIVSVADALTSRQIPFVILTGYGPARVNTHCPEATVLDKPVDVQNFCRSGVPVFQGRRRAALRQRSLPFPAHPQMISVSARSGGGGGTPREARHRRSRAVSARGLPEPAGRTSGRG